MVSNPAPDLPVGGHRYRRHRPEDTLLYQVVERTYPEFLELMCRQLSTIVKDLARWRQDRTAILMWIGIPLLIGALVTSLMDGGNGGKPTGTLLIVDQDESFVSSFVAGAYSQGELGELILVEKVALDEGRQRIDAGDASGLLVIPPDFGDALIDSTPVTLTLLTNPSQTILPAIITDVTEILLDAGFYLDELFGDEIVLIKEAMDNVEAPDAATVSAIAIAINAKVESVAPQLFPPAIDLSVVEPPAEDATSVPLALLFLPGIILMAMMFTASSLAEDYWAEREQGTLRRLVFAPGQLASFVLGKAIAATLMVTAIATVALLIGFAYHGVPFARLATSIPWIALSGIALFAWFGVLQLLLPNRQSASLASSIVVFPLLMAGGSFFPFAAMPGWIASIGRLTPNGFVADRLTNEITATASGAIDAASWALIVVAALTGLMLNVWRLRAGFARAS